LIAEARTILSATDVKKVYRTPFGEGTTALDGTSLSLGEGEYCGLVGPNGAGKSTLMKLIVGIEAMDSGTIRIESEDGGSIGYVPERPAFYDSLSAFDNLLYFARLTGREDPDALARGLLGEFGLSSRGKDKVSGYSRGMRQRLAIARSLLKAPSLLILDEPFSGLDPSMAIDLKERLIGMKGTGITMLISSHNLAEIESICDTVAFMKVGKIIMKSPVNLGDSKDEIMVKVRLKEDFEPSSELTCALVSKNSRTLEFKVLSSDIPKLVSKLVAEGAEIESVETLKKDIESLYSSIFMEVDHDREEG
jgi:ABC-2 type transport system ATP-binding protein